MMHFRVRAGGKFYSVEEEALRSALPCAYFLSFAGEQIEIPRDTWRIWRAEYRRGALVERSLKAMVIAACGNEDVTREFAPSLYLTQYGSSSLPHWLLDHRTPTAAQVAANREVHDWLQSLRDEADAPSDRTYATIAGEYRV